MPKIIAVSKTFPMSEILPLINYGHKHFGENKVQESIKKWTEIKEKNKNIMLHMVGRLQTNKAKYAVGLFDYIHSVDSLKLANKIIDEQIKQSKKIKIFIQVNIGQEIQKSGIHLNDVNKLVEDCRKLNLDIVGLMCLPPLNGPSKNYFSKIKEKNDELKFRELSLGMSNDFVEAIVHKTTFIRIGTGIFGERN